MNDLPLADVSPNVNHLHHVQEGRAVPAELAKAALPSFGVSFKPSLHKVDERLTVSRALPLFGFSLKNNAATQCVCVSNVALGSSAPRLRSSHQATQRKHAGAFVTAHFHCVLPCPSTLIFSL
jgi:hypothetical protein